MTTANTSNAFTDGEAKEKHPSATEKLASVAHEAVDQAAEKGAAAEKVVRDAAERANARAQNATGRAEDAGAEAIDRAKTAIEANPLAAAGAAFAVGFVLSALMRR